MEDIEYFVFQKNDTEHVAVYINKEKEKSFKVQNYV